MKYKDVEAAGFCDVKPERAEKYVKISGGGKAYTDFRAMYDEINPDMVFICVPPYCHGEIEYETITRGIPMFVEKPVTLNLDMAYDISRRIKEKKLVTAVGFQCRYDNLNETARDYVNKNTVVTAQGSRLGGIPETEWWNNKKLSGGQLPEQTIHQVDLLRYLLGEADKVYSVPRRGIITNEESPGFNTEDVSVSIITFKSGVSCTLTTGCYSLNGASWDSKITFGSRSSRMDYRLLTDVTVYGLGEGGAAAEIEGVIKGDGMQRKSDDETGFTVKSVTDVGVICDRTFVDAAITGDASKIRSPYDDAVKSLAITLACNESMETGHPVKVRV